MSSQLSSARLSVTPVLLIIGVCDQKTWGLGKFRFSRGIGTLIEANLNTRISINSVRSSPNGRYTLRHPFCGSALSYRESMNKLSDPCSGSTYPEDCVPSWRIIGAQIR